MSDDAPPEDASDDFADLAAHPLTRARLDKYRAVMEDGGFAYAFRRSDTSDQLRHRYSDLEPGENSGDIVTIAGRLMNTRVMGKLAFAVVSDATGTIQLFVDKRTLCRNRCHCQTAYRRLLQRRC